jgi:hypothetical protein
MTDNGIIPGLKKALINAKKGDRMLVVVPSSEAYGAKGSEGFVKPYEGIGIGMKINLDFVKEHPLIDGPCYV